MQLLFMMTKKYPGEIKDLHVDKYLIEVSGMHSKYGKEWAWLTTEVTIICKADYF